jgi:hypothetical protein
VTHFGTKNNMSINQALKTKHEGSRSQKTFAKVIVCNFSVMVLNANDSYDVFITKNVLIVIPCFSAPALLH